MHCSGAGCGTLFNIEGKSHDSLVIIEKDREEIPVFFKLCGQGESNSRLILGKDSLYHLTMAARFFRAPIIDHLGAQGNIYTTGTLLNNQPKGSLLMF